MTENEFKDELDRFFRDQREMTGKLQRKIDDEFARLRRQSLAIATVVPVAIIFIFHFLARW
jgi:hypothetical protein